MTWVSAYASLGERIRSHFRVHVQGASRTAEDSRHAFFQAFATAPQHISLANEKPASDSPANLLFRRAMGILSKEHRTDDGRSGSRGVQSPPLPEGSLEQALCDCRNNFPTADQARLRLIIVGGTKPLHSTVREQVYLIAQEALSNAMRHSGARWVEAEIEYLRPKLRVVIRDNGSGIDPKALRQNPHRGMSSMRDRAASIGGKVRVWSRSGNGTEVEISVPLAAE